MTGLPRSWSGRWSKEFRGVGRAEAAEGECAGQEAVDSGEGERDREAPEREPHGDAGEGFGREEEQNEG